MQIYRGGTETTSVAVVITDVPMILNRTSNFIYAVELCAKFLALEWVEDNEIKNLIICSDSLSALLSIEKGSTIQPKRWGEGTV